MNSHKHACNPQESAEIHRRRKDSGEGHDEDVVLADLSAIFSDSDGGSDDGFQRALPDTPPDEGVCMIWERVSKTYAAPPPNTYPVLHTHTPAELASPQESFCAGLTGNRCTCRPRHLVGSGSHRRILPRCPAMSPAFQLARA